MSDTALTINREIDDVKAQVRKEIETIHSLLSTIGYRKPSPGWNTPFQIHRLRRALRIHYLALKLRNAIHISDQGPELSWELPNKE